MVQRKRTYRKKTYKRKTYKRRYYKRRYYKRRYKLIKKPEIHIYEGDTGSVAFNNTSSGVGLFRQLNIATQQEGVSDYDTLQYKIGNKIIEGKKVRLKYLYIKGYISITGDSATYNSSQTQTGGTTGHIIDAVDDNFNCKLMVFRWKKNTTNTGITWPMLINNPPSGTPSTWTDGDRLDMLYKQDWKNDIKVNFYKKVKNLYRKYDNSNNIIPFKMRIPLYDCVMSCDCYKNNDDGLYYVNSNPSTNGLYFTFLSNKYDANTTLNYKWKLYYTDY